MTYAYIRVSTEMQTTENQRFEVENFARRREYTIDKWIDESISGLKNYTKGEFGKLVKKLKEGDTLIVTEISRIGRTIMQVMSVLDLCMQRKVKVLTIKEGFELGDNITSKVLAFAFSLASEIERNLISSRIKEALARKKAAGQKLGRPLGSHKATRVCEKHHETICKMYADGSTQAAIALKLKMHRHTIRDWINERVIPEFSAS